MSDPSTISAETRTMIERLIAFDTTSRNSNLELMDYVRGYLSEHGVESELIYNDERTKANLYATLGPTDRGGIALSGHTDVVPIDGQDWSSDPWTVREQDGKLYGRGTCDMKSFIAVALAFVPKFLAKPLTIPIHFSFSHDEEIGCVGVRSLIAALLERPVRPNACIIGEPTDMQVVNAHKGKFSMRCHVRGFEAHSSLAPKGVNAIDAAAKVIVKLQALARRKAEQGPFDHSYDIPHTTVHTGVIQGGTQLNIVPGACSFEFEFRNLPADNPQDLYAEIKAYVEDKVEPGMQAVQPDTGFSWEPMSHFPGLDTAEDADVVALAKALSGSNSLGKVAFGTEAGRFQEAGMPAVVCGPGSIEQAHKPDEYVALEQVRLCERFMERLVEHVTAPRGP